MTRLDDLQDIDELHVIEVSSPLEAEHACLSAVLLSCRTLSDPSRVLGQLRLAWRCRPQHLPPLHQQCRTAACRRTPGRTLVSLFARAVALHGSCCRPLSARSSAAVKELHGWPAACRPGRLDIQPGERERGRRGDCSRPAAAPGRRVAPLRLQLAEAGTPSCCRPTPSAPQEDKFTMPPQQGCLHVLHESMRLPAAFR